MAHPLKYTKNPIFDVLNIILPAVLDENTPPKAIDKSLLYFDSERVCGEVIKVIWKILPAHLWGLVQAYSSTISVWGKTAIWDNFKSGCFWVICATGMAGMGCNVPDILHTVVFGVPQCPKNLSTVVQCLGRTACDCTISDNCQLLFPEWAFHLLEEGSGNTKQKAEPKRNAKQCAGLQPMLKKFINSSRENPQEDQLSSWLVVIIR
jgi:hypothetical protein